jgi:hypothetical protein
MLRTEKRGQEKKKKKKDRPKTRGREKNGSASHEWMVQYIACENKSKGC